MKLKLSIFILLVNSIAFGQLYPIADQYMFNAVPINPAFTGSEEALSISGSLRAQWLGFPGAPTTQSVTIHTPLKNESSAIGLQLFSDQIGVDQNTGLYGSYAYRIKLKSSKISFGLAAGLNLVRSNSGDLQIYDQQDDLLVPNTKLGVMPNASFGVNWTSKKHFISLSIPFFMSHSFDGANFAIVNDFKRYNFLLGGGLSFNLGDKVKLKPSFLAKYQIARIPQFDLNLMFEFNRFIETGISYRTKEAGIFLLKINATRQLSFMYSFGMPFGQLLSYTKGSHEIGIKFNLRYKTPAQNPRNLAW